MAKPNVMPRDASNKRIAYLMSRFPTITETFILYEMVELERLGLHIEIFPLLRHHDGVTHPEAERMAARAHYAGPFSPAVLRAQWYWLRRGPVTYLNLWRQSIRANAQSPKFLSRALVVVPLAALFARQMLSLGVEHVHAHWATHPALAAYVVHHLTGLPYSFTAHAHDIYVDRSMLAEKVRDASFIVTISDYNRRLLGDLYGSDATAKTRVIHCGIDTTVFRPPSAPAARDPFIILCVASLRDYKGHSYLIDACAQLKRDGIPFRCLLVGEGENRAKIEAHIARLGLTEQIQLLGHVPRERVSELMATAGVVVQPSVITDQGKKEGIPVSLMEALAVERPVVATAISGIPELVEHEHTGLLVPERDASALANAIRRLYHEPALGRRLGAAGREKVLAEFNLTRNTERLYELLCRDWSMPASRRPSYSTPHSFTEEHV